MDEGGVDFVKDFEMRGAVDLLVFGTLATAITGTGGVGFGVSSSFRAGTLGDWSLLGRANWPQPELLAAFLASTIFSASAVMRSLCCATTPFPLCLVLVVSAKSNDGLL